MNFPGEAEAIRRAVEVGKAYGYGNVMDRVGMAWALSLLEQYPDWSVSTALRGALFDEERARRGSRLGREKAMAWMRAYIFADNPEGQPGHPSASPAQDNDLRAQLAEAEDLARLILHCLTRDTPLEAVGAIIREAKARLEPDGQPNPTTESPAEARLRQMAPHCRLEKTKTGGA